MKYFPSSSYLYSGGLSEVELAELMAASMDGSGDMEMSTLSYTNNPYNSDEKFPYQNQTNEVASPK